MIGGTWNPSPALRAVRIARGVEPLTPVWHRAAFYEQPGNNFAPDECVDRAVRFVVRDPDYRFGWVGDMASGSLSCMVPSCREVIFVPNPTSENLDRAEADHWDRCHREEFGA